MKKRYIGFLIFCGVWGLGMLNMTRTDLNNDIAASAIAIGILIALIIPCAMGLGLFIQNRRAKKSVIE